MLWALLGIRRFPHLLLLRVGAVHAGLPCPGASVEGFVLFVTCCRTATKVRRGYKYFAHVGDLGPSVVWNVLDLENHTLIALSGHWANVWQFGVYDVRARMLCDRESLKSVSARSWLWNEPVSRRKRATHLDLYALWFPCFYLPRYTTQTLLQLPDSQLSVLSSRSGAQV